MAASLFLFLSSLVTVVDRINIPPTTAEVKVLAIKVTLGASKTIPPHDFRFDGCTLFPEIIFGTNLTQACLMHDIAYWSGGTPAEKQAADQAFKVAVAQSGRFGTMIAPLAKEAVNIYGDTWLAHVFGAHWGFGWTN